MRRAVSFALLTTLCGCAFAPVPQLLVRSPSPGWERLFPGMSGGPNDAAELMTLYHRPTGATVRIEAWYLGVRPIPAIAEEIRSKLSFAGVFTFRPRFDGQVADFETTYFDRPGRSWRGKVAVLRLNEGPAARTFIFYGRWPAEYDLLLCRDFDELVRSATIE